MKTYFTTINTPETGSAILVSKFKDTLDGTNNFESKLSKLLKGYEINEASENFYEITKCGEYVTSDELKDIETILLSSGWERGTWDEEEDKSEIEDDPIRCSYISDIEKKVMELVRSRCEGVEKIVTLCDGRKVRRMCWEMDLGTGFNFIGNQYDLLVVESDWVYLTSKSNRNFCTPFAGNDSIHEVLHNEIMKCI